MADFSNIKVGDYVIIREYHYGFRCNNTTYHLRKVDKVNKITFKVGSNLYYKCGGNAYGEASHYYKGSYTAEEYTEEKWAKYEKIASDHKKRTELIYYLNAQVNDNIFKSMSIEDLESIKRIIEAHVKKFEEAYK